MNQDVKLYALSNSYYDFMFAHKFFQDLNWYVNKKAYNVWGKIYLSKVPNSVAPSKQGILSTIFVLGIVANE
jgi:hypothetical protein